MVNFERKLATEDHDIAEIVRGILTIQARFAAEQQRPLGRGTHTKGVCVRATFEIFDLTRTISDPALAAQLARDVFAKPGTYPAVVRFANAASLVQPDSKADVRALSFSVDFPPGVVATAATRRDFSMNDAPTFPINDAHSFAALMSVAAADGAPGKAKALWSLPLKDLWGLIKTAVRGSRQQRRPSLPFQQMRYWSNVPFRHGPDAAVKYSAIPAASNPGHRVQSGPNTLRDELVRHVNEDPQMSSFDFAFQLLDTDRMTFRGKPRDAAFWVENASIEWDETQAPFYVVGRITLVSGSVLPASACEAMYIDVTGNSAPDSQPLGSINRARWLSESGSRKARLGAEPIGAQSMTDTTSARPDEHKAAGVVGIAQTLGRRASALTVGSIVKTIAAVIAVLLLLVAALSVGTIIYTDRGGGMLPPEPVDHVEYPDQGWGAGIEAAGRQTYYYTPQGAPLRDMRYSWFVNLEMPWGRERFADPDVLRRYGFIVDEQTEKNPDRLPVGFARFYDRQLNEDVVDITCAACHTGQINVTRNGRTTALRIDGGSGLHAFTDSNFGHFVPTMLAAMLSTAANPFKFNRFARKVLGATYPEGYWTLHREFRGVMWNFAGLGFTEWWRGLAPTEEGYGRTDALARIANTVFGENLDPKNYKVGNAPVNYPPVWNIWKFDWVQYNASVSQPMARNMGESMGTGAEYVLDDRYGRPLPLEERFRTTAVLENLHTIELTLRKLRPPAWPEQVLGPIDRQKTQRGKELFDQHCAECHGPHVASAALKARNAPMKTDADPEWIVKTLCVDIIGTDPNTAVNFAQATVDITKTGLTAVELRRVARENLQLWNERQAAYLTGEIARLKTQPQTADAATQVAALETERAGLEASMEQQLSEIDPARLPVGKALSYLGTMIRDKAYQDMRYTPEQQAELNGFDILDLPQVLAAYKPRPLAGVWATPPYLHNGSVPTIYDVLSPVAERPTTFRVGSRAFDPVRVGLAAPKDGFWMFDTSLVGNRNTGHEFNKGYVKWTEGVRPQTGLIGPLLAPEDRLAIIEHLKVRNDDLDAPLKPVSRPWTDCGQATSQAASVQPAPAQ